MIFQHTWQSVIENRKTQTARLVKDGQFFEPEDSYEEDGAIVHQPAGVWRWVNGKDTAVGVWVVGRTYAVQPGRGKSAVARIRILSITRRDVRDYTAEDATREGFDNRVAFMVTYMSMNDKVAMPKFRDYDFPSDGFTTAMSFLRSRPAERYDAWVLTFALVTP